MPTTTPSVADPQVAALERRKDLLRKVREVRAHALTNRGSVMGMRDDKVYAWININEHRQVEFKSMGYEICTDPAVKTPWSKEDGTHQRGDLILYQVDKELHQAIKADEELRALEAIEAPKQNMRTALERENAGKVYEPTPR